ncbi:MAG TPA: DUF4921 family protein [Thermoanaerobaculia bacterium]|nr:DUF4921 family protein [Thermoanaerobaculia bacterium]
MTTRAHLLTGEPILFAPDRAARPHAFVGAEQDAQRCPFCPGHEADTPPPLVVVGDPWRVRVVPNKYPPVEGAEVIIESPRHDGATFDEEAMRVIVDRYRAHDDAAFTSIFKNHGPEAGASREHAHSQLVPVPFVPPRVAREIEAFEKASECPMCRVLDTHRRENLIIRETNSFAWLAPSASWMAYQQWIVPKQHANTFVDANVSELAELLGTASSKMLTLGRSYNWMFLNFPRAPKAHWYVDLFPRLTTIAGFELSTGTFVEIMDPAATARRLK